MIDFAKTISIDTCIKHTLTDSYNVYDDVCKSLGISLDTFPQQDLNACVWSIHALGCGLDDSGEDRWYKLKQQAVAWAWQYSLFKEDEALRMLVIRCGHFNETQHIYNKLLPLTPQWFKETLETFPVHKQNTLK